VGLPMSPRLVLKVSPVPWYHVHEFTFMVCLTQTQAMLVIITMTPLRRSINLGSLNTKAGIGTSTDLIILLSNIQSSLLGINGGTFQCTAKMVSSSTIGVGRYLIPILTQE